MCFDFGINSQTEGVRFDTKKKKQNNFTLLSFCILPYTTWSRISPEGFSLNVLVITSYSMLRASWFWRDILCPSSGLKSRTSKTPAPVVSRLSCSTALMMEMTCSSETSDDFQCTTWHCISEDGTLQEVLFFIKCNGYSQNLQFDNILNLLNEALQIL
jgi:hypothetical protein